jgi:subtilisin family serine protease
MFTRRIVSILLGMVFVFGIVFLFSGCTPIMPPPQIPAEGADPVNTPVPQDPNGDDVDFENPAYDPVTTSEPEPVDPVTTSIPGEPLSPYFIEEQVILIGSMNDINGVLSKLDTSIVLVEIETYSIDYLSNNNFEGRISSEHPESGSPFFGSDGYIGPVPLEMALYSISSGHTVEEVLENFLEFLGNEELIVFADPNYRTGIMAAGACGSPFGIAGSPFGIAGSPFGIAGSPDGGAAAPAPSSAYWDQWAFESTRAGSSLTGNGTVVGVFDTSPFHVNSEPTVNFSITPAPFNLTLVNPTPSRINQPLATPGFSIKEHGLFVAGLVHGVAPDSEIHLIRVLDEYGCGDVFQLARAIHEFNRQFHEDKIPMNQVVINLSLGVAKPHGENAERPAWANRSAVSLETALLASYHRGAVIVAAAGNDSDIDPDTNGARVSMHLPAGYDYVIGVAASNQDRQYTCYSNIGDIMAPGGEAEWNSASSSCQPKTMECLNEKIDSKNCPWGLISLYDANASGYAYWVGTSFATPLVSGIAAQGLGDG